MYRYGFKMAPGIPNLPKGQWAKYCSIDFRTFGWLAALLWHWILIPSSTCLGVIFFLLSFSLFDWFPVVACDWVLCPSLSFAEQMSRLLLNLFAVSFLQLCDSVQCSRFLTHGNRHMATDTLQQTHGNRHMATDTWQQTHGNRHMATDTWQQMCGVRH